MANIIKDFLGYLKLGEDEDFDEYLEEPEEPERRPRRREAERAERQFAKAEKSEGSVSPRRYESETSNVSSIESKRERTVRPIEKDKPVSKVVPIRTTSKGMEVCIMKPANFEDSQEICDMLLSGRAAVVNLEGFDPLEAQRIMDFVSGAVYAINGKLHQISRYIFIFSPDSIDITGDYLGMMEDDSFEVPTLSKDF